MSETMSEFSEQWRSYRDQGLEQFLWKGQVYTTRREGEDVKDWKTNMDKRKAAAGRPGRGAGSPLPGSRGHTIAGVPREPRADDEQAATRALNTARASAEQLYVNGEVSWAGFKRLSEQADAYDDLRYGKPAEAPEDEEDDGIDVEPHRPLDDNIVVDGNAIQAAVGGPMDSRKAEAVGFIMGAYSRGAITQGQAALLVRRVERA